jgi:hypothetical protein
MNIQVDMKMESVVKLLRSLPREIVPLAAVRSLNKTAVSAKSMAIKSVAAHIGIAQKEVRPFIVLQKATLRCLDAVLMALKAKRLPLIKIDPRAKQGRAGVTYRGAGGMRRTIPQAFLATMPTGHRGIYARAPGAKRLPIRELAGPSIYYVFTQAGVQTAIEKTVKERWPVCCVQELNFELQRRKLT